MCTSNIITDIGLIMYVPILKGLTPAITLVLLGIQSPFSMQCACPHSRLEKLHSFGLPSPIMIFHIYIYTYIYTYTRIYMEYICTYTYIYIYTHVSCERINLKPFRVVIINKDRNIYSFVLLQLKEPINIS
jgi:hypothetical protein